MITSTSGLPHETVLLKYIDLEMIRKYFQSIEESILVSSSSTDLKSYILLKEQISKIFHE
jgi:hypothetical protein